MVSELRIFTNWLRSLSPRAAGDAPAGPWTIILVSLAALSALLLPLNLLANQPLHHDEALYATWGLAVLSGDDPWLVDTAVDKPPLFLYSVAGTMRLLGVSDTVTRLPSLVASTLVVLLTFWLGRKIYRGGDGLVAAWLVAVSPFTLLFAATAFTDPMLVALVLGATLAAAYHRPIPAGLGLALAIATKQQGVFFVPLIMAFLALSGPVETRTNGYVSTRSVFLSRPALRIYLRFGLTLLLSLTPFLVWDFRRNQPSAFFEQSLANYGGLSANFTGLGERWFGFVGLLHYGTGSPALNTVFVIGLGLLLSYGLWLVATSRRDHDPRAHSQIENQVTTTGGAQPTTANDTAQPLSPETRMVYADWVMALFVPGYLLAHALASFQIWDRYLLGLMPFLALLLARVLLLPFTVISRHWLGDYPIRRYWLGLLSAIILLAVLVLSLQSPVRDAINARYPLGSNSHHLHGLKQVAAYLRGHVGADSTLYHQWLGTHWRFYLWDYPYDLQYWAEPAELVAKAEAGHLIAYPAWQSETEIRLALHQAGLSLRQLTRAYGPDGAPSITLYRIETRR